MHIPDAPRTDSEPLRVAEQILPVSALNRIARETLEQRFPLLWVSGEVSNLTRAASGHCYFSLKDDSAQVRCVMFRNRAELLPFQLQNGTQVEARVRVTLYEARGDFQLNVDTLRRGGVGSLYEAFLRLKDTLNREGLFDPARKRPLPALPRRIGIVTSLAAAALRDVLAALKRRAGHVDVIIYPAPVQGDGAGAMLARVLTEAGRRAECDLIILTRGGGSIEDLWAFNDESLARAIAQSPMPVITGIGHETDFTIADFAADQRAATPTAAAELASAGHLAATRLIEAQRERLSRASIRMLERHAQRLDLAARGLKHPRSRLALAALKLESLRERLSRCLHNEHPRRRALLAPLETRLKSRRPTLALAAHRLDHAQQRLPAAMARLMRQHLERIDTLATHLGHLDPSAILRRGYSITRNPAGQIVQDADTLSPGDLVDIQFAHGRTRAKVQP